MSRDEDRKYIAERMAEYSSAWPGIIRSFNATLQTVAVDIALLKLSGEAFTILVDVPISIPTCQGFHLTLPIKAGDECLVIIADRCYDNWFDNGGVQDQAEYRLHDIADGFALIGVNSKPNVISSYNTNDAEFRNDAGDQYVRLKVNKDIEIITPANIKANCVDATITATGDITATCVNANVTASTEATVTAPAIKLDGAVEITGTLLVAGASTLAGGAVGLAGGALTISNGANVIGTLAATTDVTGAGISLAGHKHHGVQTGGGNTGAAF